jgi:catalase
MARPDSSAQRSPWLPLAGIAAIIGALALAFAWTAGWIGGGRITAQRMVDTIEAGNPQPSPGYRRAHAKGICFAGTFSASGDAAALSAARAFTQREMPLLGRFSIGGGDPHGADGGARVRSMALLLRTDDGDEWRMAMNSFPFFVVGTPAAFHEQMLANRPDPATGKPDPARQAAFAQKHPEARRFGAWAAEAPWPDSLANTEYNGVHAFRLRAADGTERFARWSMRPRTPLEVLTPEQRSQADEDFLAQDLRNRLTQGPLLWDMVVTIAGARDNVTDPSVAWPAGRTHVIAGTVSVSAASDQATGACRDINFDPLILPRGVAASDDPVLAARSGVYSESFNRREIEIARGEADEATGAAR